MTEDGSGYDADRTGELPARTRIGRVALRANDRDRVAGFYRDVVGLEVLDAGGDRTTLGAGGEPLLEVHAAPDAPDRGAGAAGLFHHAIRVPSRSALGDALRRVRERWRLDGASDHHVSEALYFTDPEGNGVEVYRDRPRSAWPVGDDGRVEMDTLPLDTDAVADQADGTSGVPAETTVGHVHLEVSDLAAAREFYVDTLGFRVRQEWGPSALFVAAGGYHHHVGLNTWNGRTDPAGDTRGLAWFELEVPDGDAVGAVRERLGARGASVGDGGAGGTIEASDPDRIRVRVRSPSRG